MYKMSYLVNSIVTNISCVSKYMYHYLDQTPIVYQQALERRQKYVKYDGVIGSTLIYNEHSYDLTNQLYNEIIHLRFLLYRIMKYIEYI
jgi:hypothetical protein